MFMKPSTREYFRESRKLGRYGFAEWLHGYVYGRWAYFYISVGTGEHVLVKKFKPIASMLYRLFKGVTKIGDGGAKGAAVSWADAYHGKVVTLDSARKLVTLNQPIELPNLEKVVPYPRARDLILKNPGQIAVLECPCRTARENPCLPLDVCLIVGEPFVSFMIEHHPTKARKITQDEAIQILEVENERGHVSHAFFKDAMLDRFYAICNCCSCCCGAMNAHRKGNPMLASSGYVCQIDGFRCVSCGECVELCQFSAIDLEAENRIDLENCMGCGVCVNGCPEDALALVREPARGEPLEIHALMEEFAKN
jgi:ferredoxin